VDYVQQYCQDVPYVRHRDALIAKQITISIKLMGNAITAQIICQDVLSVLVKQYAFHAKMDIMYSIRLVKNALQYQTACIA
jgi:hypothetical protein